MVASAISKDLISSGKGKVPGTLGNHFRRTLSRVKRRFARAPQRDQRTNGLFIDEHEQRPP
jgi:hypothetical protein